MGMGWGLQRAGDMLDAEIKKWAAGKQGNVRALLSTLQYVSATWVFYVPSQCAKRNPECREGFGDQLEVGF